MKSLWEKSDWKEPSSVNSAPDKTPSEQIVQIFDQDQDQGFSNLIQALKIGSGTAVSVLTGAHPSSVCGLLREQAQESQESTHAEEFNSTLNDIPFTEKLKLIKQIASNLREPKNRK
ncbi:hypothetical protein DdX_19637 [Ditylenchus destructor]|uniref:Uncharacterized protein n=1 Tax=Ditylenchus destructor TaxID=166010 RepID=A0AAD4QX35_9BILA|nr:hypothetical protein DdX_19637 [Ditylenchus destructor]